METFDPALSRVAYLMIVQRGDTERFRFLCSTFKHKPVEVLWDRRTAERRKVADTPATDRRKVDRRSPPPSSWNNLGFLVARNREGEPSRG